jgi:hypothetical protein
MDQTILQCEAVENLTSHLAHSFPAGALYSPFLTTQLPAQQFPPQLSPSNYYYRDDHHKTLPASKIQSSFFSSAIKRSVKVVFCVRTGTEFHFICLSIYIDPIHDRRVIGDAGHKTRILGFGVGKETVLLKNQRQRSSEENTCAN